MTSTISSPTFFESFLIEKNISYQTRSINNLTVYIINVTIAHGKQSGLTVTIGLPIPPDFEVNAPYGLHVQKNHGIEGNIKPPTASPLGSDWEFWSRQVPNWNTSSNKPQHYFDYVMRWLER